MGRTPYCCGGVRVVTVVMRLAGGESLGLLPMPWHNRPSLSWRMIVPKFLYTLGAFGVDGVPAFFPLHGRVLGVQAQSFCSRCPHCQLGVQIGCCVECVPILLNRTFRATLMHLPTISMASAFEPAVVGLVSVADMLCCACLSGCLVG